MRCKAFAIHITLSRFSDKICLIMEMRGQLPGEIQTTEKCHDDVEVMSVRKGHRRDFHDGFKPVH